MNLMHEDHVVRYVKPKFVIKGDDGAALGVFPQAFELRPEEEYLSTSWREFYQGTRVEQLKKVRRDTTLQCASSAVFASVNVGAFHSACTNCSRKVRIIHEPVEGIPAHSSIRQFPKDDQVLQTQLADLASNDFMQVKELSL